MLLARIFGPLRLSRASRLCLQRAVLPERTLLRVSRKAPDSPPCLSTLRDSRPGGSGGSSSADRGPWRAEPSSPSVCPELRKSACHEHLDMSPDAPREKWRERG